MDRSFLREDASPETAGLTTAVVSLGDTLDLEVVAEGIELANQASVLRDLGCGLGQGFLFAKAMSSPDLMRYLRSVYDSAGPEAQADAA
jgi:EAL domain-containing protein (putative c-di-GMP-specific phosphodiesterase class I)